MKAIKLDVMFSGSSIIIWHHSSSTAASASSYASSSNFFVHFNFNCGLGRSLSLEQHHTVREVDFHFCCKDSSSAFSSRLHAAGLLGANTVDAGIAPSLEFPNLVWQTWYRCDYCGIAKASTSGVKNGRTRIRCQCGGTRQDGVLRLHQQ